MDGAVFIGYQNGITDMKSQCFQPFAFHRNLGICGASGIVWVCTGCGTVRVENFHFLCFHIHQIWKIIHSPAKLSVENAEKPLAEKSGLHGRVRNGVFGSVMPDTGKKVLWDVPIGILMKVRWKKFL